MDFLTIYRKDYIPKYYEKTLPATFPQDYDDPITGPRTEYLPPIHKLNKLSISSNYEHPDTYLSKLLLQKPNLKKQMFAEPLDHEIVTDYINQERLTQYQKDYCLYEDTFRQHTQVTLPDNWESPATTQRANYRHPSIMGKYIDIRPRRPVRLVECLKPDEKLHNIMKVKTGQSEYQARIGKLGEEIVTYKYFGEKEPLKVPDKWELRRKEAGLIDN